MVNPDSILKALQQARTEHAIGALSQAPTDVDPAFYLGKAVGFMAGLKTAEDIVIAQLRGEREEDT